MTYSTGNTARPNRRKRPEGGLWGIWLVPAALLMLALAILLLTPAGGAEEDGSAAGASTDSGETDGPENDAAHAPKANGSAPEDRTGDAEAPEAGGLKKTENAAGETKADAPETESAKGEPARLARADRPDNRAAIPGTPPEFAGPTRPAEFPRTVVGRVRGSLYGSFQQHFDSKDPDERLAAEQLAAHFKRLFFFDIDFKRDLRPDDRYAFTWTRTDESTDGIRILAARYESRKHKKLYSAYYYHDPAEVFARHYDASGRSVQKDLKNSPLKDYEQVTSLLKDRRPRHLGIDFKAPVGTPVTLPYDARVLHVQRKIQRRNGRWLKVRYDSSGLEALFLHLDAIEPGIRVGEHLKAGTPIAAVGNTGRSYSAHLHYQIQHGHGRVLNPYTHHGSRRRLVSEKGRAAFLRLVADCERRFPEWGAADDI